MCRALSRLLPLAILLSVASLASGAAPDHAAFDEILREAVRGERVDYDLIEKTHRPALRCYLDALAEAELDGLGRDERLTYYLNLYNATVIEAVLERQANARRAGGVYSVAEDDFAIFKAPLVRLPGGKKISLNDLEHAIIRPEFKDPRIHAALVCAAVSCPPLIGRAYRSEDLDRVLEENFRRFVNDPKRNAIDPARKELRLSKIFDWYADDFGGREKLAAFVGKYLERDVEGYRVTFNEYDWGLNDARGQ